mmetsp:Transcript_30270/g.87245  ORF Transcript_30270/g.87245 Transcript_30270/m.87245 type:complete len:247 (-) Transcript_30270:37-777(-)
MIQTTPIIKAQTKSQTWKLNTKRIPGPATSCRYRFVDSGHKLLSSHPDCLGVRSFMRDRCRRASLSPSAFTTSLLAMSTNQATTITNKTPASMRKPRPAYKRSCTHREPPPWNPVLHLRHVSVPSFAHSSQPSTMQARQTLRFVSPMGRCGLTSRQSAGTATHENTQGLDSAIKGHSSGHNARLSLDAFAATPTPQGKGATTSLAVSSPFVASGLTRCTARAPMSPAEPCTRAPSTRPPILRPSPP